MFLKIVRLSIFHNKIVLQFRIRIVTDCLSGPRRDPIALIKFLIYDINTLPEHYTQGKNFVFGPFTSKSADFYEIIRPKGAEKQAVSLRNGLEK